MACHAGIDQVRPMFLERGARESLTDEALVKISLSGDEDAFRVLYERYRRRVTATVSRIIRDRDDAEDVAQEVFTKIYRSLPSWEPARAKFSTWIYRLASNHAIDCWRSRRRSFDILSNGEEMLEGARPRSTCADFGTDIDPERDLEQKETIAQIRRSVDSLPPLQRRVFFLRHFQGFKLNEIAASEGHKLATVKTSLYRATQHLRHRLRLLNGFGEEDLVAAAN